MYFEFESSILGEEIVILHTHTQCYIKFQGFVIGRSIFFLKIKLLLKIKFIQLLDAAKFIHQCYQTKLFPFICPPIPPHTYTFLGSLQKKQHKIHKYYIMLMLFLLLFCLCDVDESWSFYYYRYYIFFYFICSVF